MAAAVATLPLVGLVAYSAVDRYDADHARAVTRASTRADLYAELIAEVHGAQPPSKNRLEKLLALTPPVDGSVVEILDRSGRPLTVAGTAGAGRPSSGKLGPLLATGSGTLTGDLGRPRDLGDAVAGALRLAGTHRLRPRGDRAETRSGDCGGSGRARPCSRVPACRAPDGADPAVGRGGGQ
jgi:hypothetical protein